MFDEVKSTLVEAAEALQEVEPPVEPSGEGSDALSTMKAHLMAHKPVVVHYTQSRLLPSSIELALGDQIDAKMLYETEQEYSGRGAPQFYLARKPLDLVRSLRKSTVEMVRRPVQLKDSINIMGLPVNLYLVGVVWPTKK